MPKIQNNYSNTFPEDKELECLSEGFSLETVQRIAFATLPFFSLYKPLSFPLAMGMGGIRIWQSFDNLWAAFQKQEATENEKLHTLINTSISIISLAGTIFAHPLGMCITTVYELIVEMTVCKEHLSRGDWASSSESLAKILNHSLYLACILSGGLELSIASMSIQLLLGIYSARKEFVNGHYIEATGHLVMSLIKGHQLRGQIQTLQTKWKIEKLLSDKPRTSRNIEPSFKEEGKTPESPELKVLPPEEKEKIRLELEKLGFDVYKITNGGDNVLLQAVRKNNEEAILLALQYGCDLSFQNKAGDTALHIAAGKGNLGLVQMLVRQGAPIHIQNKLDQMPFHKGFEYSEIRDYFTSIGQERTSFIEEYAIANGLRPDYIDNQGNTFMHNLVKSNNTALLELALAEGYKLEQLDIANKKGFLPFDLVITQKNKPMLDLFINRFGDRYVSYNSLHQAAHLGWKPGLETLLPFFDKEILLNLSEGRPVSTITGKELTQNGLYVHVGNHVYSRPEKNLLHEAIYSGDLDTVKFLVEYGFSPTLPTHSDYKQPIYLSSTWSSQDWADLAELDNFCQTNPSTIVKPGGYVNPVLSPLSIAEYCHPENQDLLDYLKSHQGEKLYYSSINATTPDQFFEQSSQFNPFFMNTAKKTSPFYFYMRPPGKYWVNESGEWILC